MNSYLQSYLYTGREGLHVISNPSKSEPPYFQEHTADIFRVDSAHKLNTISKRIFRNASYFISLIPFWQKS